LDWFVEARHEKKAPRGGAVIWELVQRGRQFENLSQLAAGVYAGTRVWLHEIIATAMVAIGRLGAKWICCFGLRSPVPLAMLNYFPIIAWAGAALLGWIGGDVIATDPVIVEYAAS
jgi:hypothetical protein